MRLVVISAEGNLQSKLYIDCKSLDLYFEKIWVLIDLCRMRVRHGSTSDGP